MTTKRTIPMSRWSIRRSALAFLGLMLLVNACTTGASTGPSTRPSTRLATTSPAGPGASASPGAGDGAAPSTPSGATTEPPPASLAAEGGDPVAGQLGSFTWGDGGSDSPWLAGTPGAVGSGEPLTVTIADGTGVAAWSARRVPAGTTDGSHAVALGSGDARIAFPAPGPGSWSVQLMVQFADNLGSATYYWQLAVR